MKAFWFAVIAAVLWGTTPIIEKIALSKGINPMFAVVLRTVGSALAALVLLAFLSRYKSSFTNFSWNAMVLLMIGGMMANVIGQVFFYKALQTGDVSRILPITGAYPMIAFVLGILVLGEAVTVQKVAGAALILGGIIMLK
jgi:bacterial/archaeal transporter family protein